MMLEHFEQIGRAAPAPPKYVYNAPAEMDGTRVTTALTLRLLDSLPTFMGIIDVSPDWQFMIDVVSTAGAKHERFQILSGSVL